MVHLLPWRPKILIHEWKRSFLRIPIYTKVTHAHCYIAVHGLQIYWSDRFNCVRVAAEDNYISHWKELKCLILWLITENKTSFKFIRYYNTEQLLIMMIRPNTDDGRLTDRSGADKSWKKNNQTRRANKQRSGGIFPCKFIRRLYQRPSVDYSNRLYLSRLC